MLIEIFHLAEVLLILTEYMSSALDVLILNWKNLLDFVKLCLLIAHHTLHINSWFVKETKNILIILFYLYLKRSQLSVEYLYR